MRKYRLFLLLLLSILFHDSGGTSYRATRGVALPLPGQHQPLTPIPPPNPLPHSVMEERASSSFPSPSFDTPEVRNDLRSAQDGLIYYASPPGGSVRWQQQSQRDEDTATFIENLFASPSPPHHAHERVIASLQHAHGESSKVPGLYTPSSSAQSPASQEQHGTKRKSGADNVDGVTEISMREKDEGMKPIARRKRQRLREITWNLDARAEQEHLNANRLFQACLLGSDRKGRCHFRPLRPEKDSLGEDGQKLYHALIRKYGYHRDNVKRRKEAKGIDAAAHEPSSSTPLVWGDKEQAQTVIEDTCKALRRKLLDITTGRRKGTSFHRKDLQKILELEQKVRVPYCDVEVAFERFLQQAPTIKRHWHENVLKRYGESEAWPEITSEVVASVFNWLAKYGDRGCQD